LFLFQLAKGGIERQIYTKLIAQIKNDLPASEVEAYRRVCAEHKYAYFGLNLLKTTFSYFIPCKVIPLPGNTYRGTWAFIMSKNITYKGLINWR
jgi:hypothetical protein